MYSTYTVYIQDDMGKFLEYLGLEEKGPQGKANTVR